MEVNLAECSGQLKLDHIPFGPLQRDGSALRSHPTDSASRDRAVHDLGNLLQIVSSGIKVAQRCIREGRSDDAISLLAQVDASVHRAGGFARETLQRGTAIPSRFIRVEMDTFLRRLETPMRLALGSQSTLRVRASDDLPPLHCVEAELENALLNLVINARQAMPLGGHVEVEACRVVGVASNADEAIVLRFSDTGHGMSEAVAARAFEPRFSARAGGNGLGLAIVSDFARALGGKASIESTSTEGTSIALYLPCGAAQHGQPPVA